MGHDGTWELKGLEGRHVSVALVNGCRIDDCQLVSAPGARIHTLWVFTNGKDVFVPMSEITDVWETVPPTRCRAA